MRGEISGRNRSLCCKKLPKKRGFDLQRINEIKNEELKKWLINRHEKKFNIIDDPYKLSTSNLRKIKEKLEEKYLDKLECEELKIKIGEINQKYRKELQDEEEKLKKQLDNILAYTHSLKSLSKEITALKKETGRDELYIGYPFVEGKFKDNSFVRAPLFLFPVSININGDTVSLLNNADSPILLNKVFILAHSKFNETKAFDMEVKCESLNEDFIQDTLKELKKNDIHIIYENNEFEKFREYTEKNIPNYNIGTLFIKNYTVLGQFPISNSIYTDYECLEGKDKGQLLKDLLHTKNNTSISDYEIKEEHGKLSFSEKDLYFVSNLDYSQEKAVKKASESKNLVIYGPPGTGKSQTIANIIADALAKNKRVLMVSQKKAALDVIYNRLGSLSSKAIIVHDANKDKKAFYEKIKNTLEDVKVNDMNLENNISLKAEIIDEHIQMLESLAKVLNEKRDYGISLQEMYAISSDIVSKKDDRYEDFLKFRRKNSFKSYKYQQLNEVVNNLDDTKLSAFINYEDMRSKNSYIEDINYKMNFMDIDELIRNIKETRKSINMITDKRNSNKHIYDSIMLMFEGKEINLEEKRVLDFAKDLNSKNNGYFLQKLNNGRWWSVFYWRDYSKNKKQEEENKLLYIQKENEICNKSLEIYRDILTGLNELSIVKKAINERAYNIVVQEFLKCKDLTKHFESIIEALNFVEKHRNDLEIVSTFNKLEKHILTHCYDRNRDNYKKNLNNLVEFSTLDHIHEIEKENKVEENLKKIDKFNGIVNKIKSAIEKKKELTGEYILNKGDKNTYKVTLHKTYKDFKHQANKKRALYPIRKYIEIYDKLLLDIFPCFLLSPETVSEILPLKKELFDMVIFDEASQMYIENAIPSIFRAKGVIVAGDDKQLRPSSTFSSRYIEEIDEEDEENRENLAALEEESLLDLAKINYDNVHLTYHYRSQSEELINFSNYAFYDGRLQIAPNVCADNDYGLPIERIKVDDGMWENNENIKEAEEVIDLVDKLFKERKNKDTIGIITFNKKQQDLIEDLLEKRAQEDDEFKKVYIEEIDRVDNDEDVSLFVKNIENVQGDERDIIIFSTAYAKNINKRVYSNFGTLNQDGGENRLNVAISRAKKKIYVVTSVEPEDFSVENSKNNGPKLLKKYLQYVRAVSNDNKEEQRFILNGLLDTSIKSNTLRRNHDSDFEAEVYDELVKRGYEVHTQVGVSGYKIDLAIYDKKKSKYVLGIECDGATYHSSKSARERDIHRQQYLESRGWIICRIWSRHWWRSPKSEIDKVDNLIKGVYN